MALSSSPFMMKSIGGKRCPGCTIQVEWSESVEHSSVLLVEISLFPKHRFCSTNEISEHALDLTRGV